MNVATIVLTAIAAAAPMIAPILSSMPAWAQAISSGAIAAASALYHLYQPAPS